MKTYEFTASFLFCGLGAGALGFLRAIAQLGEAGARFKNLGGVDIDREACRDFQYLTGAPAVVADVAKMTPDELRAAWGASAPDCVFLSAPCKGFSGLLSKKSAASPKYTALNRLALQGLFLLIETWPDAPPPLLVFENVPRITTRGAALLAQVRQLLAGYGYLFHEASHDCGEIGGLAQHRRRYLLVARRPAQVPNYIYKPPRRRVRACGEVLGQLPLPGESAAGELHKLPRLSWLNWVRLALIPAGGDWRDLPGMAPKSAEAREAWEQRGEKTPGEVHWFKGKYGVGEWEKPSRTVVGGPSNGACAIADPRLGLGRTAEKAKGFKGRPGLFGVADWKKPTGAITGKLSVSGGNGTAAVADPRLSSPLEPGQERRALWGRYDIRPWGEPAKTVAGEGSNGGYGVADPRVALPENPDRHWNKYHVTSWQEPAPTVTGARPVTSGGPAVADPRPPEWFRGILGVKHWGEPAPTVTGNGRPTAGAFSVADPRLKCAPRAGSYGVISWQEAAATITGNARIDNGAFAVADPRDPGEINVPIIIAADGTWHRPLTTLELAALQGLPAEVDGKPLALAGKSVARWRERIGNAVPVGAAAAIAESLLTALLAARLGTWTLGAGGIWVEKRPACHETTPSPLREQEDRDQGAHE